MSTEDSERIAESDCISRLEYAQGPMATKADLAALETRLIKWMIGIGISVIAAMVSLTVAALTVLYRLLS